MTRRVAMLGPAPPDRGGIARETRLLFEELSRRAEVSWFTYSRNWALLIGYLLADDAPFEPRGRQTVTRANGFGPYIPLPVARAIVLNSRVASGPIEVEGQEPSYAYRLSGAADRGKLLNWISTQREVGDARRRFRWLLSALSESTVMGDALPVPVMLQRKLFELSDIPEAAILSGKRIPRRLLPHLHRAVQLAGV